MIEVVPCRAEHASAWRDFLRASNNGTLFHDLDFLAYHPPDRFKTHHLLFFEDGTLCALLPAAEVSGPDGRSFLKSPYGASVGGLVLPAGQPPTQTRRLVEALKEYAAAADLAGIELRIAPTFYQRDAHDHLGFALFAGGFLLSRRWLTHAIPLPASPDAVVDLVQRRKMRHIRAALKSGIVPREQGVDSLPRFFEILLADRAEHGAVPTHTQRDIEFLMSRLPGRVRLFLCQVDGQEAAGMLFFALNRSVGYTFYLAQDPALPTSYAAAALNYHVAHLAAAEGFSFLDLGPSSFDDLTLNEGLAAFKESFGARGFCRDTWKWERD